MNSIQKRFALFLGACIPLRFLIVYLVKNIHINYLHYLGYIALIPAFGFLYLYFTGKRQTGPETQGAPIWWSKFRIIHGLLYLLFAIYAINKIAFAYQFLLLDVIIGLILFLWHHFISGNFSKLFM
tara:strand:- start:20 stop:397 length:378 start_codon:yes stop_codon:yes gene_type:complete